MPYPSKIDLETIIECSRVMIENGGVNNLSVNVLAKELGVTAPSLYRYIKNKNDLLLAVNTNTAQRLYAAMSIEQTDTTQAQIIKITQAYRTFAHENPMVYGLLFTNTIEAIHPDADELEQGVLPFQALIAEITGEANSLVALRGLWALIHGFVMLELAGQFRRGGNLDDVFQSTVQAYLDGFA